VTGNEIRAKFLEFFEARGHRVVRSSSLVPIGDPTLLFTNAGMNQFKDVFLGLEQRGYKRATSAQKCVRAGGKHNDLENVGFTRRHHTFFEMLGNFSFGDYFKKEAIAYAWELIASPRSFGIPKDKLYVTIFAGENGIARDDEAYQRWLEQGVEKERIFEFGANDNFWAMGETGPCGPCSEIHYDMGPEASDQGHSFCPFGCDCGRYVEIWNLVFMEFNRDESGALTHLPKPCVDTGAGLERLAAVLQGKISNYDIDLFTPLIREAARLTEVDAEKSENQPSLRIIADHFRAATFLIADGVAPSNEARGYVLRKILRRAFRHARSLNPDHWPFVSDMAGAVRTLMEGAYPELAGAATQTSKLLDAEEDRFHRVTAAGLEKLEDEVRPLLAEKYLAEHPGAAQAELEKIFGQGASWGRLQPDKNPTYPGNKAFRLYDTYGLPLDFIKDVLSDQGISFQEEQFHRAMEEQRARAKASWKGAYKEAAKPIYTQIAAAFQTEPDFHFSTTARDCRIEAIVKAGTSVSQIEAGETAEVILDRTVIYAESGGQVADTGVFYDSSESLDLAEVKGAYYPVAGLIAHKIVAKETLHVGDRVAVVADAERREHIKRNHTGTHLVHAALRNILGAHVKQAGSLNDSDHLRFDFSHFSPVDPEELRDIEQQVNDQIRANAEIETAVTSLEDALNSGALAFFGDKYPEQNVRVVTIPDPHSPRSFYSRELCGGTHVRRSGDIGLLKIVSEESIAAGVRRIEAVTGARGLENYQRSVALLARLAAELNVGEDAVLTAVEKLSQTTRQLEKQLETHKRKGAMSLLDDLVAQAQVIKGVKLVAAEVQDVDREGLRQLVDGLRQRLGSGVIALGVSRDGKVALIIGVTKDLIDRLHAGKLVQALAKQVGGTGGGRPDLAEAGGKDTSGLESALRSIPSLIEQLL
jgi:alanyl-tRNA synthetase